MFQAVLSIAVRALNTGILQGVNQSLAGDVGALVGVVDGWFFGWLRGHGWFGASSSRPFAFFRTLVGGFCSVFEAEGAAAGFAAEREEVELTAELELAVSPDGFEVFVGHLRVGASVLRRPGGAVLGDGYGRHGESGKWRRRRKRPQGDVEDKSARDAAGIRWLRGES